MLLLLSQLCEMSCAGHQTYDVASCEHQWLQGSYNDDWFFAMLDFGDKPASTAWVDYEAMQQ